jgi:hypothetical protein
MGRIAIAVQVCSGCFGIVCFVCRNLQMVDALLPNKINGKNHHGGARYQLFYVVDSGKNVAEYNILVCLHKIDGHTFVHFSFDICHTLYRTFAV